MIPTPLALVALAVILAGAFIAGLQGAPWPFWVGTALAAGAPAAFILRHSRSGKNLKEHPLVVSIASGLGCVAGMTAAQRFGPAHDWTLWASLAALAVWMLWQRDRRRQFREPGSRT